MKRRLLKKYTLIISIIISTFGANAQDSTKFYFYHNQNYGSESQFGHLNVATTIGFSVVGSGFWGYRPGDIPYAEGFETMINSFANPSQIVDSYGGYDKFIFQEFVPILGINSYPNYLFHFLGEGMLSRKLYEYNLSKGMSKSKSRFWAVTAVTAGQLLNEVVEAPIVWRGDAIADMVFNIMGIVAFSHDGFARKFSNEKVKLYYWPGQPMIDIRDGALYNNSETYLLRAGLGKWTKAKFDFLIGLPSTGIGLSYPINTKDKIAAFVILAQAPILPRYPYNIPKVERFLPISQRPTTPVSDTTSTSLTQDAVRLTWDRDGSLMTSLEIGYPKLNFTLNIYPGVLKFGNLKLGTFAHIDTEYPSAFGPTMSWMPMMPGFRFNSF
jgi:hypothetical protein